MTVVGQRTDLHAGVFPIQNIVLSVSRKRRRSTIFSRRVFARQFWHRFLIYIGLQNVTPLPNDADFFLWWQQAGDRISAGVLPGFNTLVVLGAWTIWKARNDAVFESIAPSVDRALLLAREEAELWMLSGAKG